VDNVILYVDALFTVYVIILFIRILMSWVPMSPVKPVARAIYDFFHQSTDWFLNFFRRIIPPVGIFDLSPVVALLVLFVVRGLTLNILESF
jgi:uncharacterized protein YggT (Ycf19 family)